jgi:hypothetical protein
MSGCAGITAGIDTDFAIQELATVNIGNVELATADKMAVRHMESAKLETLFENKLLASAGGAAAAKLYTDYKAKKAEHAKLIAADVAQYTKMMKTATALKSLSDTKVALTARWRAWVGGLPGAGQVTDLAELKVRKYMASLQQGAGQ